MTMIKPSGAYQRVGWNEPWRRARLVQRACPHLDEGNTPHLVGWIIALGVLLAAVTICLLWLA